MNWDVFITCAITGAGDTTGKSPHVPVTPEQIAASAIDAAKAGAAIVHIHVRDPDTGVGARTTELYAEVVERIRDSGVDVVINLTAGMGGDMVLGGAEDVLPLAVDGHRHGRRHRAARPRADVAPRDLHARLRHDELRVGWRLHHGQLAGRAAVDGEPGAGARRAPRARGVRHRPPGDGQGDDPRRAARRPGDDPAVHGHRLRRARRPQHVHGARQRRAARARCSRRSRSRGCSSRSSPWPRSPAATCASASRTTCTSGAVISPPTPSSSPAPSRSWRA